jgi:hypothetical protein
MAAFNFQPQHIVANPYTFFYKADTTEHREKLRIIFPLVLGSIDATTLSRQRELKDAEREYDKIRRELDARTKAGGNNPSERSPDIEGVRRIFAALAQFMSVLKGQFQVIVTEHAGSITWRGIDHVHLVGNWREGHDDYLIPVEWQTKPA